MAVLAQRANAFTVAGRNRLQTQGIKLLLFSLVDEAQAAQIGGGFMHCRPKSAFGKWFGRGFAQWLGLGPGLGDTICSCPRPTLAATTPLILLP